MMNQMNTLFGRLLLGALLMGFLLGPENRAEAKMSWKRTDKNARVVGKMAEDYLTKLKKIAEKSEGDSVGDYDQADEIAIYMENQLSEAYAALLYGASQSSNQDRYMKRVSRSISKEQNLQLQKALKLIKALARYEDGEVRVQQYILESADSWAAQEIKSAKKSFEKEFRTLVTEKSRERLKDLPGA